MSRRTETAYKAESPGKSAQHDEALDSGDTVNAAVASSQFTFLSGEACSVCISFGGAPVMATCRGTGQESAEAIVGRGNKPGEMEKKPGKDLPRRRAEHREGKNRHELSGHEESVWRSEHGARHGTVRPK